MEDKNYIVIQGWMVNQLKLSGSELLVYAIIYGFCQDEGEDSKYRGSAKYISDSVGISRRAVTDVLDKLVKHKFINKFERYVNGIKVCDYQTVFELIPKDNKEGKSEGGMEDSARGRKNLPGGYEETSQGRKNLPGGYEETSQGRKNLPGGYEETSQGYEESSHHKTLDINLDRVAAAASSPDSHTGPPPDKTQLSPQDIRDALQSLDKTFILREDFYPTAAAFMTRHGLDIGYLKWLYRQCKLKNPNSWAGWYHNVCTTDNRAEQYKAIRQAKTAPPPPDVPCPVCGTLHRQHDACPACGLPDNPDSNTVTLYHQLHRLPPEQRNEYLSRKQAIDNECGLKDFIKHKQLVSNLQKEFGLVTA